MLIEENRLTSVIAILNCEVVREELSNENVELLNTYLLTEPFGNLEEKDEKIQNFNLRGSKRRFQRVISLNILMIDYHPLGGSSYIEIPEFIAKKETIINIKNEDNVCVKWRITRASNPVAKKNSKSNKDPYSTIEKLS